VSDPGPISEHVIKLRGGWEWHDPAEASGLRRATLPLDEFPAAPGRFRLVRHFQTPPLDPHSESLLLRLEHVPGLVSVSFNGVNLPTEPSGVAPIWLRLEGTLARRNTLSLEIEPSAFSTFSSVATSWGIISLVIRRNE
jgi:hypothetical protein